ncbi:MAG: hypothetical protein ACXIVQ_14815 [Acidimicrobiales bacterium]
MATRPSPAIRRAARVTLLVAFGLATMATVLAVWSARTMFDTDRFTAAVMRSAGEPEVTDAVAAALVDQVVTVAADRRVLADRIDPDLEPLLPLVGAAVRPAVEDEVSALLGSDRAQGLLEDAVRTAHASAVRVLRSEPLVGTGPVAVEGGEVRLDLSALLALTLERLADRGLVPELPTLPLDDTIDAASLRAAVQEATGITLPDRYGTVVILESDALARAGTVVDTARQAVTTFERAVVLLVVVTLGLGAANIAISDDRRRAGLQMGLVVAAVGVTSVVSARHVASEIPGVVADPEARRAVATLVSGFSSGLVRLSEILVLVALVAIVVAWLAGPGTVPVAMRRRVGEAGGVVSVVAAEGDTVRLAGLAIAAALVLWLGASAATVLLAGVVVATAALAPLLARQVLDRES